MTDTYYKSQGFEHLRTLEFHNPWDCPSAALFQKPTAEIDAAATARFTETGPGLPKWPEFNRRLHEIPSPARGPGTCQAVPPGRWPGAPRRRARAGTRDAR
jgi:hypothetical protein